MRCAVEAWRTLLLASSVGRSTRLMWLLSLSTWPNQRSQDIGRCHCGRFCVRISLLSQRCQKRARTFEREARSDGLGVLDLVFTTMTLLRPYVLQAAVLPLLYCQIQKRMTRFQLPSQGDTSKLGAKLVHPGIALSFGAALSEGSAISFNDATSIVCASRMSRLRDTFPPTVRLARMLSLHVSKSAWASTCPGWLTYAEGQLGQRGHTLRLERITNPASEGDLLGTLNKIRCRIHGTRHSAKRKAVFNQLYAHEQGQSQPAHLTVQIAVFFRPDQGSSLKTTCRETLRAMRISLSSSDGYTPIVITKSPAAQEHRRT